MYKLKSNSYSISIAQEEGKDKYFTFYPSFYEALSAPSITDQEFRLAIQLMYELYFEGLEIKSEELPASLYAPFRLIGENLKASKKRSRTNSENGKKGGAKTKENAEKARILDAEHQAGNTDQLSIMESMFETDIEPAKTKKKNFVKPTVEDLKQYANEQSLSVDADKFFDFYQANGWKVGKNPMKDWRAALRNWSRRDSKEASPPPVPSKVFFEKEHCPVCHKTTLVWDNLTQKYTCKTCNSIFKLNEVLKNV